MARERWKRVKGSRRRRFFFRRARIAIKHGVPKATAFYIAFVCAIRRLSPALGFALVEQESSFRHIFGSDFGPVGDGPPYSGQPVTKERFRRLRDWAIRERAGNGVGLTQVTYWTYLRDHPRIWRPLPNLIVGLGLMHASVKAYGKREGLARYNGGPTPPSQSYRYADSVLAIEAKWRQRFEGR